MCLVVLTGIQLRLLRSKSLELIDRVVELGEGIGDFPAVDICFESPGDSRIFWISL